MKIHLLFLLSILAFALVAVAQDDPDTLNIYSFSYNGTNYDVVMNMHSWPMAAQVAVTKGGHLVHLEDAAEADQVYSEIINGAGVLSNYTIVNDGGGIAYVWIGANDIATEGMWVWDGNNTGQGPIFWMGQGAAGDDDGVPIGGAYNKWGGTSTGTPNEPDDFLDSQDAAAIALDIWPGGTGGLGIAGEWNDIDVSNKLYYVIEYGVIGINEEKETKMNAWVDAEQHMINIQIDKAQEYTASLYSMDGRMLYSVSLSGASTQFSYEGAAPGIYLLSVDIDGQQINKKLMIR